jgi:hypothetical protein
MQKRFLSISVAVFMTYEFILCSVAIVDFMKFLGIYFNIIRILT